MENRQTAVEWYHTKLAEPTTQAKDVNTIFLLAKAMEKEQIVDAFDNGAEEWTPIEYSDGQHYYNHNFES
jgi:hypothetical protein